MWNNTERLSRIFAGWKIGWIICAEHRNKKFFDPAIFQKCWRGSGRVALIAARRQRNPCAMLLAHGGGGEKSESFSRRRTRPPRLVKLERETSILQLFRGNSCNEMFHGKHFEIASRETTRNRFGKAGAHPQLAWESQLPLKPCISLQPLDFKSNCDSSDWFLDVCFISWCSFDLLRKCGLLAHTSAAFLKNCCTEKLFIACGSLFAAKIVLFWCDVSCETFWNCS